MPEEAPLEAPLEDAGCLGAALVGVSDLFPNSEPTALSKKPAEAGLGVAGCLGAAFEGVAGLVANSEPTTLSKKPFEVPASMYNDTILGKLSIHDIWSHSFVCPTSC